jgi:NAD(P)-dependent dehydrogenase (short-subunit alcohol dehydrogenase family)
MSKFALEAFTDCLRQELAPWGMHVVCIEPGAIDTAMWDKVQQADWTVEASEHHLDLYREGYTALRAFETKNATEAVPCDVVSRAVYHALTARKPRARYLVGRDAQLFARIAQLFPTRIVDWITRKVMGLGRTRCGSSSPAPAPQ